MKNKMTVKWVLIFILSLLPLLITAVMYSKMPDQMPMHWGINGEVNRYSDKSELWMVGALSPLMAAMFYFMPKIDPRRKNYSKFMGAYETLALGTVVFLTALQGIMIMEGINPGHISMGKVVVIGCGLLFMLIGNYMPKMKNNFFVGIRTPWTLSNQEVWNRTHRLAGPIWVGGSLLIIALALLTSEMAMFVGMMVIVAVMALVPIIMSYVWYQKGDMK